jgi:Protein of unknown function (DUF1552)
MTDRLCRRQVLRGLGSGAVLAAGLLRAVRAEAAAPQRRAVFIFYANGSNPAWAPAQEGPDFVLTPHLEPLAPIRKEIVVLRNLTLARGRGNPHKASTFSALGAGAGTSFDQRLAAITRRSTPLPSLELAIGFTGGGGGVAPSLSQVDGVFLPGERNPFAAFARVAARVSPAKVLRARPGRDGSPVAALMAGRRSVLDHLTEDLQTFRGRLSGPERHKAELYLASVRDLEKNLGALATELGRAPACGRMLPPADTANYIARVSDMPKVSRIFLDVMAMALACGVTSVASLMWGGGESDEPVEFMGMRDWHSTTHLDPDGPGGKKVIAMQAYLAGEFTYFVERLRGFPQGDGRTLLDESVVVLGTQNGNSNQTNFAKEDHDRRNTPFVVAGRLGGQIRPGRLIDCKERNHNDLYLAIARGFGLRDATMGDPEWCQGPLPGLA